VTSLELDGVARLDAHYAEFRGLVETARRHLDRGRYDAAAGYCQIAGMYAWMNPVGLFGSDELEALLGRLSARLPAAPAAARAPSGPARTVLHVATQVYQTGGSTQAIASWIEQDPGRRHRVCITRQGPVEIPPKITDRLQSDSDLLCLDARPGGLLARSAALRAAAADADVVVLHLHPCDVVPSIALAGAGDAPPIVYVDHADHVFWLGRSVTRLLLSMRDSGRSLAVSRRGIEPERCFVMPRPLRVAERSVARDEAKRRLGLEPDRVLVVTAADGSKYRPVGEPAFLDLVLPFMSRHPDVIFRAAGPAPEGDWAAASEATGGRLRALGRLPDVSVLQQAADVYLDSFPFSSLTSLLEAGAFGTPVVTYRGHPEDCLVLGADTRGLDEHMLCPTSVDEFQRDMSGLLTSRERRSQLGERTRRAIIDTHTGAGWRANVAELYGRAAGVSATPRLATAQRQTGRLDVLIDLVMEQTGFSQGVPGAVRANLGLLSTRERIAAWRGLVRADEPWTAGDVVPDCLRPAAARVRRQARAVTARLTRGAPAPSRTA
jgi:glycosyltransferase involved in cell wall biosynthesis